MSTWYIQNGVLCHHGIKGQKWGVRNAEWYPIAAWKESVGGAITKYKNKKKMAKVRAAKEEKAKAQAEREKILNTATPNQLVKLNKKYQFTSEEIKKVQDRFANEKALKDLANTTAKNRVKEFSDKIGPIMDAMKLFNSVVSTTVAAKNNIDKIRGLLKDQEDSDEKKDDKEDKEDSTSSKSSNTPKSSAKDSKGSKWDTQDKDDRNNPNSDAYKKAFNEWYKQNARTKTDEWYKQNGYTKTGPGRWEKWETYEWSEFHNPADMYNKVYKESAKELKGLSQLQLPAQDMLLLEDKLKHSAITHHGVEGMKWGVRNGPPYPIQRNGSNDKSKSDYTPLKQYLFQVASTMPHMAFAIGASMAKGGHPAFALGALPIVVADIIPLAKALKGIALENSYKKEREKAPIDKKTGLHKKTREMTDDEDLKRINPAVENFNGNTKSNCALCTVAYDIRKRGYDVQAGRASTGYSLKELCEEWYPGASTKAITFNDSGKSTTYKRNKEDAERFEKGLSNFILKKYGEGSRGDLSVKWLGTNAGHSIIYQVKNGKVEYLDGQSNMRYDTSFFERINGGVAITRLDNVEPNWKKIKELMD